MKTVRFHITYFFVFALLAFTAITVFAKDSYFVGMYSKPALERIRELEPDNYIASYFLGQIYLNEGNLDKAAAEWDRYLSISPEDSKSAATRERLTIIKMMLAKEYAEKAKENPSWILEKQIQGNTIAVLNFINRGQTPADDILSKGLTAMIITDLSHVPELKVVEREKMQTLLEEIRLGQTGLIDERTALETGKLLLAKHIVQGSIRSSEADNLKISSMVTETITSKNMGSSDSEGPRPEFFRLQKEILFGILKTLGYEKKDLDPALRQLLERFHTKNFDALISYAKGLDFQDQGMFDDARNAFSLAVDLDPEFDLAIDALKSTPKDIGLDDWGTLEALHPVREQEDKLAEPLENTTEVVVTDDGETPDPPYSPDRNPGETPEPPPKP
jgi:TolB-like protein